MEFFRLVLEHLAWIEHQFLSGIRDSRKAGSLWGMMRDVARVRKSIYQCWLAKDLGLLREFMKRFRRKRPALIKSGQWQVHQDNAPIHNSILVTDYLTKKGIKTVPHRHYSTDFAPCDFLLFPKLRGCCYETVEERKEAVTWRRSLTRSHRGLPWGLPEVVGMIKQVLCSGGDFFEVD